VARHECRRIPSAMLTGLGKPASYRVTCSSTLSLIRSPTPPWTLSFARSVCDSGLKGDLRSRNFWQLIPFLRDKNPQVRQVALSNLLPQTPKGAPHRSLFFEGLQTGGLQKPKDSNLIRDLKLLCRDQVVSNLYLIRMTNRHSDSAKL